MITNNELHRIRTGEATAREAKSAIRSLIAENGEDAAAAVYGALRGWTWKAMQMRRFDQELGEWHRLIKAVSVALRPNDTAASALVEGLAHLVDESVRYAASHSHTQLATRSHVGELLEFVEHNNGRIERERLEALSGLSSSRLSQLLSELVLAGFLERQPEGRNVTLLLSEAGREFLHDWRRVRREKVGAKTSPGKPADLPPLSRLTAVDKEAAAEPIFKPCPPSSIRPEKEADASGVLWNREITQARTADHSDNFAGWMPTTNKPIVYDDAPQVHAPAFRFMPAFQELEHAD